MRTPKNGVGTPQATRFLATLASPKFPFALQHKSLWPRRKVVVDPLNL
jgi:hypothetical protein